MKTFSINHSVFPWNLSNIIHFFKTLIRWINISLEFYLKVICRIWMFRVDGNHFILNGSWWKLSQLIMVFFLEIYQFLFIFFKTLIRWINISLEFYLKVICIIWMFRVYGNNFILNGSWWKPSQLIMVFFLKTYQVLSMFFKILIRWISIRFEFALKVFWWEYV